MLFAPMAKPHKARQLRIDPFLRGGRVFGVVKK